jgi:hypothetical protein
MLEYGRSGGGSGYGAGAGRTGEARRVAAASTAASRNGLLVTVRSHLCVFFFPLVFLKSYPLILDLTMRLYFTLRLSHHSPFVLQQKKRLRLCLDRPVLECIQPRSQFKERE